eukprot:7066254-Heterocapsa_arctica.AAC.1
MTWDDSTTFRPGKLPGQNDFQDMQDVHSIIIRVDPEPDPETWQTLERAASQSFPGAWISFYDHEQANQAISIPVNGGNIPAIIQRLSEYS